MRAKYLPFDQIPPYLLVLSKNQKGIRESVGSAFLIAEEWAVTAKHVLLEFFNIKWPGEKPKEYVKCAIIGASCNRKAKAHVIWEAFEAYALLGSDIALIRMKIKEGSAPDKDSIPKINLKVPTPEQKLTGLGFPHSRIEVNGIKVNWFARPKFCNGNIEEFHFQRRDSSMLNFPSYQIEADFQPGMSGGPVLNESQEIVGIISSGLDINLSYAAMIWPIYMNILEHNINVQVINSHCVSIVKNPKSGELIRVEYKY